MRAINIGSYNKPQLILLTRVLGIYFITSLLSIVQRGKLSIKVHFRTSAKSNVFGLVLGGISGILVAVQGIFVLVKFDNRIYLISKIS